MTVETFVIKGRPENIFPESFAIITAERDGHYEVAEVIFRPPLNIIRRPGDLRRSPAQRGALHMDWATFTRDQVNNDLLPRVCIVCGEPTVECVNKTFSHTPQWVEYLYLAGIFPGMIAEHVCAKEMRVSCPVCPKHRTHWSNLVWVASLGWLLAVPFALVGLALGAAFFPIADPRAIGAVGFGTNIGLITWLAIVIRLTVTRVKVAKISITGDEITFERVSDAFARSAAETKMPPPPL